MVTHVLLLSLGTFSLLNLIKSLIQIRLLPSAKLLASAVMSTVVVLPLAESSRQGTLMAMGVFGLSALFHATHKLVGAMGDYFRARAIDSLRR